MGFRDRHDITDIYGVRSKRSFGLDESDAPETGFRHSGSYHRFFRGYTEVRKKNAKGRIVVERYYTKPWIVSGLPRWKYWLVRLLYALLAAASVVLYITAMCQDVPGNFSWVVALPGLPSMVILFLLVVVTVLYIFVAKRMTLWDHASSTKRLKAMSLVAAACEALTGLTLAVYSLYNGEQILRSLGCAATVLLAACCSAALFFLERKMPYTEIPNHTKVPEGETYEIW